MSVMIVTSLGDLVIDLFTDRCPLTSKNFLKLCKIKYYNGCLFHSVQKDFTAQTGDPTGTGSGGDSLYKFLYGDQARFFGDEMHLDLKHSKTGTVAMASAGENLNASQFYITLRDDLDYLDGKHTVFGEVAEGFETLTRINEAYVDEKGRPYKNIRIKHTYVLDDPFDDPPQLPELIPDASPEGKPKDEVTEDVRLEDDWVPIDEQLGSHELEELVREKEAHSRAVVLESIGDIPDAEVKPPDNVLFVCKLNPVTEDEDLHTIFSRFGTVSSAEIIRDFKTGDSLCYAFIEFEDKDACEQAYFKMDNALIDDRRIHVDFSQSVSKLWNEFRRKGQGKGCFKCGSLDHIAKDCPGDPTVKQQHTKYILRDENTQRGGNDNSRYEMVFAEDAVGSPRGSKRRGDHENEMQDGKTSKRNDDGRSHLRDRRAHTDGNHDRRGEDSYHRSRTSLYGGKDRDSRVKDERDYRRKADSASRDETEYNKRPANDGHRDRRDGREYEKERENDVGHRDQREGKDYERRREDDKGHGRDGREYEKKREDDVGHRAREGKDYERRREDDATHGRDGRQYQKKRENEVGHRDKREGKDFERRREDDVGHGYRKHDGDSRKRSDDYDLQASHRHHSDNHDRDGSYSRTVDSDNRKGRREDLVHDKRSSKGEDARNRDPGRRR